MCAHLKANNTIGCCGIDCGLCPRFISKSNSSCPGCGAKDFLNKHPSCGFLTCCAKKHKLEVCANCEDYPCKRFDSEREGYDSFVTHKKIFVNHKQIQDIGLDGFLKQQKHRIETLDYLISNFDNGRSKNLFCLTCALLPAENLNEIQKNGELIDSEKSLQERNKIMHKLIIDVSKSLNIDLSLRKKSKSN